MAESANQGIEGQEVGTAWFLGYAGLIPFLGLAGAAAAGFEGYPTAAWFNLYSAVILSFLGGIRWGVCAASSTPLSADLWLSIVVSLAAWGALLLPGGWTVPALLAGHVITGILDQVQPPAGQRPWLKALRLRLSAGAIVAHLLILIL